MKPKRTFKQKMKREPIAVRRNVFEAVVDDDMPDGAYFAMAEEFGLEPEDLADNA